MCPHKDNEYGIYYGCAERSENGDATNDGMRAPNAFRHIARFLSFVLPRHGSSTGVPTSLGMQPVDLLFRVLRAKHVSDVFLAFLLTAGLHSVLKKSVYPTLRRRTNLTYRQAARPNTSNPGTVHCRCLFLDIHTRLLQVERLRARRSGDKQEPTDGFPKGKEPYGPLLSRVVDIPSHIPSATDAKPKPLLVKRQQCSRGGGDTETRSNSGDEIVVVSPTGESRDQDPDQEEGHCSSSSEVNRPSARSYPDEEETASDTKDPQQHSYPRENQHRYRQSPGSASRHRNNGGGRGRRRLRHGGEALVSSRARAGLLGVLAPGGSRGYLTIDGPIATVSSARGGSGGGGQARADGREAGGKTGWS